MDGSRKWYHDKGEWKGKKLTPTDGFHYSKLNGEPGLFNSAISQLCYAPILQVINKTKLQISDAVHLLPTIFSKKMPYSRLLKVL